MDKGLPPGFDANRDELVSGLGDDYDGLWVLQFSQRDGMLLVDRDYTAEEKHELLRLFRSPKYLVTGKELDDGTREFAYQSRDELIDGSKFWVREFEGGPLKLYRVTGVKAGDWKPYAAFIDANELMSSGPST